MPLTKSVVKPKTRIIPPRIPDRQKPGPNVTKMAPTIPKRVEPSIIKKSVPEHTHTRHVSSSDDSSDSSSSDDSSDSSDDSSDDSASV